MKKYELTTESKIQFGCTLYRIKALISFTTISGEEIHVGDLGGFVQSEKNLSQVSGNAWVSGNAQVSDDARVSSIKHILYINPIGENNTSITFFRTKHKTINVSFEDSCYSFTEFVKIAAKWSGKHKVIIEAAFKIAKTHIETDDEK
jgi:hypothetical protein